MKKILFFITALVLLFSLACCSARIEESEEEVASVNAATEETKASNTVTVTFPEGFTVTRIAERLEENGVCSALDFINECNNREYLEEYGIDIPTPENRSFLLEGYLFPDTYEFYIGESASSAVRRFLSNFNSKYTDEMKERAAELGYTFDEILSLASIIEKETYFAEDLKKIASVLHNRLNSSSFPCLQCDVSKSYLRNYVEPYVTQERYEEIYPLYNSYTCKGIPEGPISSPSFAAVEAALYPESTDYYYFVTDKENKQSYYAVTYEEHLENCKKAGW